jgi:hypothetical protein
VGLIEPGIAQVHAKHRTLSAIQHGLIKAGMKRHKRIFTNEFNNFH